MQTGWLKDPITFKDQFPPPVTNEVSKATYGNKQGDSLGCQVVLNPTPMGKTLQGHARVRAAFAVCISW